MSLSKIFSEKHNDKCFSVFHNRNAKHKERLWVVGFLKWIGYTYSEICSIIHRNNRWEDYNEGITRKMVFSIKPSERTYKTAKKRLTSNDMLLHFLTNTMPILPFSVSPECQEAAYQYFLMGFIPVPKVLASKRPSIPWKQFINSPPSLRQLESWDFSNGICLLAGNGINFLDIDEQIDHIMLKDRHYEVSPRGGIHLFGRGNLSTKNELKSEIKGMGSLIVCYPTRGYLIVR